MSSQKELAPKLRFPQFEKDGKWKFEPFDKVYDLLITNSFSRADLNYEKGDVKNIHYGDIHTKFSVMFDITQEDVPFINPAVSIEKINEENYCEEGDLVLADASEDLDDIGKTLEIINLNKEKILAGLHTLLARQKKDKLRIGFGGYLFKSTFIREQIKKESQGAKVLGISKSRLSNIKLTFPNNKNEQQKIVDCLSSLDQLIIAHNDKLEALKDHKKGLLQNLLPQEGQKVPNYRFPEFRDEGAWVEMSIEQIASVTTGNKDTQNKEDDGKYPFFVRSQTIEKINSFSYDGEAILTSGDGVGVGKNFHYINGKFDFHQRVYCIYNFSKEVNGKFIYMYFSKHFYRRVMKMSAKNSVDSVRKAMVTEMPILLPDIKEQQKIASCLFIVDKLITDQTNKIEHLQQHKKGLMQGLFPQVTS